MAGDDKLTDKRQKEAKHKEKGFQGKERQGKEKGSRAVVLAGSGGAGGQKERNKLS